MPKRAAPGILRYVRGEWVIPYFWMVINLATVVAGFTTIID